MSINNANTFNLAILTLETTGIKISRATTRTQIAEIKRNKLIPVFSLVIEYNFSTYNYDDYLIAIKKSL